ncbi:ABC transporter permease subunit [Ruegeria pomeroyi]|uniref:Glycine betaine/proline ABC transporter, permease protein n=2 Tax=Ruegeria pomeroyi TaxID=89184 RepID=Q5LUC1_RUEPO|nr:ABC transporter permease subunit [Ruegeria pomeroyi]AAV94433.1 glycine betaine/proline ABC transporter, permease protein [Ruegeria pomeroyi DSS-3]NVK99435.1 ABC transporter permease subunit [Ruegeria pomeroyi]QWV08015.1 ABC transporter permease subunit [Ruegeria pomeroyi]
MSAADISVPRVARLTVGTWAALITALVGALCLALEPVAPWLGAWPKAWVLPATDWVGTVMTAFLAWFKPVARLFSAVMVYPMDAANWVLNATPWPLVIGIVTALGWYLGGAAMAALGLGGLGFVLASGYWHEGMNTLALVAVSVPLALLVGGAIGILANEVPRIRGAVQAVLDIMQTVPTFAYLTPLLALFGFGPVVGLIASAIYAAPPMARNVMLGLERVEAEVKEAAIMSGGTRMQQLFQVEIPSASRQIMVGFNQCLMAALSMVIIAAVIGGFNDIGWEVLLTMRKAQFGAALLAGMVIVAFAVIIDRMSAVLATERKRHDIRVVWALLGLALAFTLVFWTRLPAASDLTLLDPVAVSLDQGLTRFTQANGAALDALKNNTLYYVLLPLRIGLDQAVLPFTWGFSWTPQMSSALFALGAVLALGMAWAGRASAGLMILIGFGMIETGITNLPWPFVLTGAAALGYVAGGRRLALMVVILLGTILVSGLWDRALLSLYLCGASVFACAVLGGAIGVASAVWTPVWRVVRPICDMLQTIPLFVFLIPVLMVFQIGEFSAFLAICAYAIVPMIRYTRHGLVDTPDEMMEAAISSGATDWQILRDVRAPYAAPTILLGLNQTILYAFSMLVIAALIGTTGLGQSIYLALGQADVGLGISAGAAMAILALIADRLVQGFAEERRKALGL